MANKVTNKSLDFRMSKKVAELTQVVHMLFTRNHEKEVELDALKEAYEKEIDNVISDAKGRIGRLEKIVEDLQKQNVQDELRTMHESRLEEVEEEWRKKLDKSDKLLQEERTESQKSHDLLIQTQKDMEQLREQLSLGLQENRESASEKDNEIDALKNHVTTLERQVQELERHSGQSLAELQRVDTKHRQELQRLKTMLEEGNKVKDTLGSKNKQLEAKLKSAKRDVEQRRASEVSWSDTSPQPAREDYSAEIERLRREVRRYRMELSNREGNFNRMFTEQRPVFVEQRHVRAPSVQGGQWSGQHPAALAANPGVSSSGRDPRAAYSYNSSPHGRDTFDGEESHAPGRRDSHLGKRLPNLGLDVRSRIQKMTRPRPLAATRDTLSSR